MGSGTMLTKFNCLSTCKTFCPEMIEDTVKIGIEAIKDKAWAYRKGAGHLGIHNALISFSAGGKGL